MSLQVASPIRTVSPSIGRASVRDFHQSADPAPPYEYLLESYRELHSLLAHSLLSQADALPTEAECRQISQAYLRLPRHFASGGDHGIEGLAKDQYEMKMAMGHWRDQTKRCLLQGLETLDVGESTAVESLNALKEVGIQVHDYEFQALAAKYVHGASPSPIARALASLLARQGALGPARASLLEAAPADIRLEAGPLVFPEMWAEKTTDIPFKKWASNPAYGAYQNLTAKTVDFRGMHLRSGDILIVDEARPVAGFMPALFTPRQNTNHFGVLAILSHQGRWIPVVFDFADTFRIIPLNLFLSERFCNNAYVLRHREMNDAKTLAAAEILKSYHDRGDLAFSMDGEEGADITQGMTCGTFVLDYFSRQGLS